MSYETAQKLMPHSCLKEEKELINDFYEREVKVKKMHPNAEHPKKATSLAGAYDIKVTRIEKVSPDFVICWVGMAFGLPENTRLMLNPRSSLVNTTWILQNSPGLGDADYVNEYSFRFRALPTGIDTNNQFTYDKFPYNVGDRIGQIYLEEIIPISFRDVDDLPKFDRIDGYGSTGR